MDEAPLAAARVRELRRYPVKSMGGESLATVEVDERGVVGDRWYAVEDPERRFAAGKDTVRFRRRDPVFAYAAATTDDGVVVRRGRATWMAGDPALDTELSTAMGVPITVAAETDVPHFDDGAVSLIGTASLAWCEANLDVDADRRRIRPNVVVETSEPFVEETWLGRLVQVGAVELRITQRIQRCRTVDLAQDGVAGTTPLLKALGRSREVCLGVYAEVVTPGRIAVGDPVIPA